MSVTITRDSLFQHYFYLDDKTTPPEFNCPIIVWFNHQPFCKRQDQGQVWSTGSSQMFMGCQGGNVEALN